MHVRLRLVACAQCHGEHLGEQLSARLHTAAQPHWQAPTMRTVSTSICCRHLCVRCACSCDASRVGLALMNLQAVLVHVNVHVCCRLLPVCCTESCMPPVCASPSVSAARMRPCAPRPSPPPCTPAAPPHRCLVSVLSHSGSGLDTSTGSDASSSSSSWLVAPSSGTGAPPVDIDAMRSRSRAWPLDALARDTWVLWRVGLFGVQKQQEEALNRMKAEDAQASLTASKKASDTHTHWQPLLCDGAQIRCLNR